MKVSGQWEGGTVTATTARHDGGGGGWGLTYGADLRGYARSLALTMVAFYKTLEADELRRSGTGTEAGGR